jgi:hypothetical protein
MVRNRCKFGKEALGIHKTYEKLKKKTGCDGFFYVKESKRDQKFCDRECQKKYNDLIKNYEND